MNKNSTELLHFRVSKECDALYFAVNFIRYACATSGNDRTILHIHVSYLVSLL